MAAITRDEGAMGEAACAVESQAGGWRFLLPGWRIEVGAAGAGTAAFPAYPRIADPLCAPGVLTCGAAAMAFDPICGDGTGNAIREAILACAVIRAAARGEPMDALLSHYRARLLAAFGKHLELALEFYRAANTGPWWAEEIRAMEEGARWGQRELAQMPPFRYRLEGFELAPISDRSTPAPHTR